MVLHVKELLLISLSLIPHSAASSFLILFIIIWSARYLFIYFLSALYLRPTRTETSGELRLCLLCALLHPLGLEQGLAQGKALNKYLWSEWLSEF